jgi:hypothetical protein
MCNFSGIFSHEMEALLDALRRDLRTEQTKSFGDTPDVHFHRQNVRKSLRLLETLNPRGPHRHNYQPAQMVKSGRHDERESTLAPSYMSTPHKIDFFLHNDKGVTLALRKRRN